VHVALFCMVGIFLHTVALLCLLFFGFFDAACERYRKHFIKDLPLNVKEDQQVV
jgi:hypothetical protein